MNNKTLTVIEPFFSLVPGDTLQLSEDGNSYVAEYNEQFAKDDTESGNIQSSYSAKLTISAEYADELVKAGYLEGPFGDDKPFVNVFNEIDNLLDTYRSELSTIDEVQLPECMRVEKTTVLKNMIKVLEHLKSTKK